VLLGTALIFSRPIGVRAPAPDAAAGGRTVR